MECDDRRARVDDELPGVRIVEHRPRDRPAENDQAGDGFNEPLDIRRADGRQDAGGTTEKRS